MGKRSKKTSKKKKKTSSGKKTLKKTKKLSWEEQAQALLNQATKKPRSSIFVLSSNGDLVMQSGAKARFDFTSVGALMAAVDGARSQLNSLLNAKADVVQFGDQYWVKNLGDWFVVGLKLPYGKSLDKLFKHLKKKRTQSAASSRTNTSEALDGLGAEAVDAAFGSES